MGKAVEFSHFGLGLIHICCTIWVNLACIYIFKHLFDITCEINVATTQDYNCWVSPVHLFACFSIHEKVLPGKWPTRTAREVYQRNFFTSGKLCPPEIQARESVGRDPGTARWKPSGHKWRFVQPIAVPGQQQPSTPKLIRITRRARWLRDADSDQNRDLMCNKVAIERTWSTCTPRPC